MSALVLGTGRSVRLLACGWQILAPRPGRRFRFGGVVAPADLTVRARAQLERAALQLALACRVRGLASIDALVAGDSVQVLELNPRPGGSLDAYGAALGLDLFALHVAACRDQALPEGALPVRAAGSLIVFAERGLTIPEGFSWPAWSADRSPSRTRIPAGAPICTILAREGDSSTLEQSLRDRAAWVQAALAGPGAACGPPPMRYDGGMMTSSVAAFS